MVKFHRIGKCSIVIHLISVVKICFLTNSDHYVVLVNRFVHIEFQKKNIARVGSIKAFSNKPLFLRVCSISFFFFSFFFFSNTVEKGEIARNEKFLLFPQCVLPFQKTFQSFSSNLELSSSTALSLEGSKFLSSMAGLNYTPNHPGF